jgi:RNA polymerase sigma-70 factor, ECF subfamily
MCVLLADSSSTEYLLLSVIGATVVRKAGEYWPYVRERANEQWLMELRGPNPDGALADLYNLLVRGLRAALGGYGGGVEANFGDFAQEALIKITGNLDSFRGESRFTTWAQKIAMNVALTELKRRRWRDVSLQELLARRGADDRGPADAQLSPEQLALQSTVLQELRRMVNEELTDRQREAVVAVLLEGMPVSEVAMRMGTNQNALYKLLHDARSKLKRQMEAAGISPHEVLAAFEEG